MIKQPSTAFINDYDAISELAHSSDSPIVLTNNDENDLVVMSYDAFARREESLRLKAKLEAAESERRMGQKGFTLAESRARLQRISNQSG